MHELTASTTTAFLKLIEDHGSMMMLRGQGNESWPLKPSISRYASYVHGYTSIFSLEYSLLSNFRQFGMPFNDFRKLSIIEQLIHAQHYGLPTRLLDWSSNPLKALFFAVEDYLMDSVNGAVYIIKPRSFNHGTGAILDDSFNRFIAFSPEILHERIAAQDAYFLSFPLSNENMDVPALSLENFSDNFILFQKIVIPAASKKSLRRQLSFLGVTHRTIYPGLEGTTRWIKSNLSEYSM